MWLDDECPQVFASISSCMWLTRHRETSRLRLFSLSITQHASVIELKFCIFKEWDRISAAAKTTTSPGTCHSVCILAFSLSSCAIFDVRIMKMDGQKRSCDHLDPHFETEIQATVIWLWIVWKLTVLRAPVWLHYVSRSPGWRSNLSHFF